jgi:hypothetical protein
VPKRKKGDRRMVKVEACMVCVCHHKSRRVRWVGHVAEMGSREVNHKEIGLDSSILG